MTNTKKAYLGRSKVTGEKIWLTDFEWSCGWYWSGGYLGNKHCHFHFDDTFLKFYRNDNCLTKEKPKNNCYIWENLEFFLTDIPEYLQAGYSDWWRVKDLFKQFYIYREAAEAFQYGGHCTGKNRNPLEINKNMADAINKHIETIIIPEIRRIFQFQ